MSKQKQSLHRKQTEKKEEKQNETNTIADNRATKEYYRGTQNTQREHTRHILLHNLNIAFG